MKRIILILGAVALSATPAFAQNGGHLVINNGNAIANSADIDSVSPSGSLQLLATVSTGGTDAGELWFGPDAVVARNDKCLWVTDSASSDIAAFQIPSLQKVQNFTDPALNANGGAGVVIAANNDYLISAWSGSGNLAVLKIGSDCSLTLVGSPISQPDIAFELTVSPNGKVAVLSYINLGRAQAYSIGPTGTLTKMGRELNFNLEIEQCRTYGCSPWGADVTSDGQFWVWGNPSLNGPATLTASLGPHGFTNAALQTYPGTGLATVGAVWFSPAGRAGNGNLYLSAFGWNDAGMGIIVTTFNAGTITYANSIVNTGAFCTGNVQTIGASGTGSPITQGWGDEVGNITIHSYTVTGTTLTPADTLTTSTTGTCPYATTGVTK